MKWLEEVWGLFVDDPIMAILALVALAVGTLLAVLGIKEVAGLIMFLVVAAGLWYTTRAD